MQRKGQRREGEEEEEEGEQSYCFWQQGKVFTGQPTVAAPPAALKQRGTWVHTAPAAVVGEKQNFEFSEAPAIKLLTIFRPKELHISL